MKFRQRLEDQVRRAIAHRQFELHFQPIASMMLTAPLLSERSSKSCSSRLAVSSGPEIAERLGLSPLTVKSHFEHIHEELRRPFRSKSAVNGTSPLLLSRRVQHGSERPDESARILVTDDDPAMVRMIIRMLAGHYQCEAATSVDEARRKLAGGSFELVLCDISMPGESGLNLARHLASEHSDTSIVFVTGLDSLEVAELASELGAHGYLVKPLQSGQLLITTMNALRRRELEIAHRAHARALEERLQAIIDMAPIPIYAKDRAHRYILANVRACELAEVESGKLMGLTDEDIMAAESAAVARNTDEFVLESGKTYSQQETMIVGGEPRVYVTTKFPLHDADGRIVAVCGISPDITDQLESRELRDELAETQRRAIEDLRASRLETVDRLGQAIEVRDAGTGKHVARMSSIAALIAHKMGWERGRTALLRAAAPMHDVGKIGVPDEILAKPGALTPKQRELMERHAEVGHAMLRGSKSELLQLAAKIAHTHHERFDGTGYPRGLAGDEIPIEGRIVAVADVFDALLSDRSYRPALPLEKAIEIVREGRGTNFDPTIVDLLLGNLDEVIAVRE